SGDDPLAGLLVRAGGGVLRVGLDERDRGGLVAAREGQVALEVDGGQLGHGVVHQVAVIAVAADADAGGALVAVALDDVLFVAALAIGVGPTAVVADQTHGPGQLDDAGARDLAELRLEAGARRTVGAELAGADDDDHVLRVDLDAGEVRGGAV